MNSKKISQLRLSNQQVTNPKFKSPKDLLSWIGAIQAQDFKSSKLAIAARLQHPTSQLIEKAIDKADILRTHILRPTWHFVAAEDIYWMLELTAPRLRGSLKSRHKELGISEKLLEKTNSLFIKALSDGQHLTRDELYPLLENAKIDYSKNRGSHFLMWAELNGLLCSGSSKNGKHTYALLEERVPKKNLLNEEESLNKLAKKYFKSHGPATIADFAWWGGLTQKRAKTGLESIQAELESFTSGEHVFWFFDIKFKANSSVKLLPAFDEFLIAYKNKTISLPFEEHRKKVHHIGMFWPFLTLDGIISGVWKLETKKSQLNFRLETFRKLSKKEQKGVEVEIEKLSQYLNQEIIF